MLVLLTRSRALLVVTGAATAFTLGAATSAHAYCRSTTIEPAFDCECAQSGIPLAWSAPVHVSYAFNERGFPNFGDAQLRATIARAMSHWTQVRCDGAPLPIEVEELSETTKLVKGPVHTEPNLNVIAHLGGSEWRVARLDPRAFALTSNWYLKTGEIIGSDLRFNGGRGLFTVCADDGCDADELDLENIATHEIGHLFGLGHSISDGSTMQCRADAQEVRKRDLERDDIEGLCAIYGGEGPIHTSSPLASRKHSRGCTVSATEPLSTLPMTSLIGALIAFLFSRKARRQ